MDFRTFAISNGPLFFLNIVTIAFYMFCMVCPLHGERIKQPLKLLLWSLICFTITYMASVIVVESAKTFESFLILDVVMVCSMYNSMTSSVWLNFFYCSQIVPAQRALFIWIKKNVKSIIYCFWIAERIYSLFDFTSMILFNINFDGFGISNNSTVVHDMPVSDFLKYFQGYIVPIVFFILRSHFAFCLCVMVTSSGSTVFYLSGHIRRMVANGQPLSCPQLRNQVRVTVTGILQGLLYVFCSVWTILNHFPGGGLYKFSDRYTDSTVINLYMLGNLFNVGAGQAVFRQRAAHIWLRAAQCCKAPQVQQSEQGV